MMKHKQHAPEVKAKVALEDYRPDPAEFSGKRTRFGGFSLSDHIGFAAA